MYQLAVTVDDGLAGVTEVVRGSDLLSSAPRQMYLQSLFDFSTPSYAHVPMLLSPDGRRLSQAGWRSGYGRSAPPDEAGGPAGGLLGYTAGLLEKPEAVSATELAQDFPGTGSGRTIFPWTVPYLPPCAAGRYCNLQKESVIMDQMEATSGLRTQKRRVPIMKKPILVVMAAGMGSRFTAD